MDDYARAFRIAYNATKSVSSHSKVYISLDYNWNQDVDGGGNSFFSTKKTLDTFYSKLKAQGKICPNLHIMHIHRDLWSQNSGMTL